MVSVMNDDVAGASDTVLCVRARCGSDLVASRSGGEGNCNGVRASIVATTSCSWRSSAADCGASDAMVSGMLCLGISCAIGASTEGDAGSGVKSEEAGSAASGDTLGFFGERAS